MGRQNKKESVAALHRSTILKAAEQVFSEKGFHAATIEDISKASEYSRRTLYAYFESKEDMLHQIVLKGLVTLRDHLIQAVQSHEDFLERYRAICEAMRHYHDNDVYSFDSVNQMKNRDIDLTNLPAVVSEIFSVGVEINTILEKFIDDGKKQGAVCEDVKSKQTVYILWSSISSLLTLAKNKGQFIAMELGITVDDFLEDGFKQIINSILTVRL
ncbi:MAG: TetR/AcrR family transcriptional regulator [Bacillaceae bacterium]